MFGRTFSTRLNLVSGGNRLKKLFLVEKLSLNFVFRGWPDYNCKMWKKLRQGLGYYDPTLMPTSFAGVIFVRAVCRKDCRRRCSYLTKQKPQTFFESNAVLGRAFPYSYNVPAGPTQFLQLAFISLDSARALILPEFPIGCRDHLPVTAAVHVPKTTMNEDCSLSFR